MKAKKTMRQKNRGLKTGKHYRKCTSWRTTKSWNKHNIKILNFANAEIVNYPIIRIIGSIQNDASACCQDTNSIVHLTVLDKTFTINLLNNTFKVLIELEEGPNTIKSKYCCETLETVISFSTATPDCAVIPLYVICEGHDGRFQAPHWENNSIESACNRITLCSKLLQSVAAEKLYEHDLGRKTFFLQSKCQIFHSKLNYLKARDLEPIELWETIGREVINSPIGSVNKKYLAFLSCTKYCGDKYTDNHTSYEDFLKITEAYVALGGGGLALFGTACLYTWPEKFEDVVYRFLDDRKVDRYQFLDDSCYRSTLGACFSTTLGSVLHELFHTFDLGHTEDGIMGRGFDNIYKVFVESNIINKNSEKFNTFQNTIQFREEFESNSLLERVLAENRKKEITIVKKYEEVDDTLLTKNCAVLLSYHRWFNHSLNKYTSTLSFDPLNKLIKSTAGIRVIEIRSPSTEMVLHNWIFIGRILKFSFQIPEEVTKKRCGESGLLVFEDTTGCLVKTKIIF